MQVHRVRPLLSASPTSILSVMWPSFGANTLDVVQFGMQGVLAALVSVEADGIPMHLILYAREYVE